MADNAMFLIAGLMSGGLFVFFLMSERVRDARIEAVCWMQEANDMRKKFTELAIRSREVQ